MPKLSCWFIRAALLHLALGVTFGALILLHKATPFYPPLWRLLAVHVELLLFGWTVQLVMGVAFWIFPRFWRSRGNEKPAWVAFVLLNLGVVLAGVGPLFVPAPMTILVGRLAEAGAALAFGLHIWSRIKPPGRPSPSA